MSTAYSEVLARIPALTDAEREQLREFLAARSGDATPRRHSIMDLEGLGKEVWEGMDAQVYVKRERDSWDG